MLRVACEGRLSVRPQYINTDLATREVTRSVALKWTRAGSSSSGGLGIHFGRTSWLSTVPAPCVASPNSKWTERLGAEPVEQELEPQVRELRLIHEAAVIEKVDSTDQLLAELGSNGELRRKSIRDEPDASFHAGRLWTHVPPSQQSQLEPYIALERGPAFDHKRQRPEAGQDVVKLTAALHLEYRQGSCVQALRVFGKGGICECVAGYVLQYYAVAKFHVPLLVLTR
jgi:hypothetical protein